MSASLTGTINNINSSTTPLGAGEFFNGDWVDVSAYSSVLMTCLTTQNGILYVEFSDDGRDLDNFKSYSVVANTTLTQSTDVGGKYFRSRLKNSGTAAQTSLSLVATLNTSEFFNVDADVTSSALPTGAATSALQSTGNNTLKDIESAVGAKTNSAATSDTGTFSLISLFKRLLEKATNFAKKSYVDSNNSTSTPLNVGATFTGTATDVSDYNALVFSCKTDQVGTIYAEFSTDGTNWDSSLPFEVYAGVNEVHRLTISKQYFRIRLTNDSASNQTYLRCQVLLGSFVALTSALNSTIYDDADATTVRPLDFNLMVAEGLYYDRNNTIKDGYTPTMGTGAVTQDLWTTSGAYTGFPATAAAAELVVAGADTGTVYYSYMPTDTSLDYTFASKAIAGAGTYALGHDIWRCNFMYFVSSSTTGFNAGLMTIRHTATPANIFVTIAVGQSQSFCAAYTVPYLSSVYIDRWQGALRGGTSGSSDGYIWYRAFGESPRYRFPFELQFGSLYFDDVDYLIKIPSRTDFVPRILNNSTNNLIAKFQYRLIKVK